MTNRPSNKAYKEAGQEFAGEGTLKEDTQFLIVESEAEKIELMGEDYRNNKQYCSFCGETGISNYGIFKSVKSNLVLLICVECKKQHKKNT